MCLPIHVQITWNGVAGCLHNLRILNILPDKTAMNEMNKEEI